MQPFQFLFGQDPETIKCMLVKHEPKDFHSKTISLGYNDDQRFVEVKQYINVGEEQDFDEWKRIAYLMRAAPELLQALQELVHKCLHTDGYNQKVDELYNAQQAINTALGTDKKVTP